MERICATLDVTLEDLAASGVTLDGEHEWEAMGPFKTGTLQLASGLAIGLMFLCVTPQGIFVWAPVAAKARDVADEVVAHLGIAPDRVSWTADPA